MSSSNGKNDVVMIELDRPRELRYGHKALKNMVSMMGKKLDDIDLENLDLGEIEKVIYCGLISDARKNNESLTLEQMEDLLDEAPTFEHIIEKLTEAFEISFGSFAASAEGNQPPPKKKWG